MDGKDIQFDAYNIDGYNYLKLRDLAYALDGSEKQFEVTWHNSNKAINLISNKTYTPVGGELSNDNNSSEKVTALLNTSAIYKDGKQEAMYLYEIKGNIFFKLRDIAQVFNFLKYLLMEKVIK